MKRNRMSAYFMHLTEAARGHSRHTPFAGIDPKPGAGQHLIFVVARAVGNLHGFLENHFGLQRSRAGVLHPKVGMQRQPLIDCRLSGHGGIAADFADALAAYQPLADFPCQRRREF